MDIKKMQKLGFSFEEIESIKKGNEDIEKGNIMSEEEFYSSLEKKIFSKKDSELNSTMTFLGHPPNPSF